MNNINWKNLGLNYILPILLYIGIAYGYFSPLLDGKKLSANDTNVSIASSKEIKDFRNKTGKEALWTNSMFSGMPAYQISVRYPGNLVKVLNKILVLGQRPASYLFLWFVSFFVLMLAFKLKPWLSFAGGLAYGFTTNFYMLVAAGHMTKVLTLGYVPLVFAGVILAYRGKRLLGSTITGIALSLMLLANHPQMAYYAGLMVMILGFVYLVDAIKEKQLVNFSISSATLVVAVLLALGTNYARVTTNASYAKHTMRGKPELTPKGAKKEDVTKGLDKSYIWAYSYGIKETFTLMIPNFMGGSSKTFSKDSEVYQQLRKKGIKDPNRVITQLPRAYWGPQYYTAGPSYFGAIICFFFILGLFLIKGKEKWWLLAVTIFSIVLSWGKHVPGIASFFIDYFPLFNKFRDMSMMLVIAQFSMPVLGLLAINEIINGKVDKKQLTKALYWSLALTAGLSLILAISPLLFNYITAPPTFFLKLLGADVSYTLDFIAQHPEIARSEEGLMGSNGWIMDAIIKDRQALLRTDAFRSFIFIALAGAAIWTYVNNKLKQPYFLAAIAVLVLVDMWPVDKRYLNDDNFVSKSRTKTPYAASKTDKAILRDKDPHYRVANLTVSPFNDASTSMYHKSIGGYHGAKLQRYQYMIEDFISPELQQIGARLKGAKSMKDIFGGLHTLNMLNTKYVITNPNAGPLLNTEAYGNAWTVNKITMAENPDDEFAKLAQINPRSEAVVDKRFADALSAFKADTISKAVIKLTSYAPNKLTYKFKSEKTEGVIFSEVYYAEGWNAYIDGEKTDHFRADFILRGLIVPAGSHDIEFRFEPREYFVGNTISLISSLILVLALLGLLGWEIKKQVQPTE